MKPPPPDNQSTERPADPRRQAAEALLKTEALQSAIFNSANFSSIATDAKGVIQIFNVGAERMLGYAAADVLNQITPADISDPREVIARAEALSLELGTTITPGFEALVFKASRGIEDIYELTYIRKDGSRFPAVVSVTALRDAHNAIIGYLLIGTDNTARKRAEELLRDIAERKRTEEAIRTLNAELEQRVEERTAELDRFFTLSLDMLCIASADGYFKRVSPAFTETLGWSAKELLARPFLDFVHPDDRTLTLGEVERLVVRGENVLDFENRYRHKDDSWRVLSWKTVPQPDGLLYCTVRDVTERQRKERELVECTSRLNAVLRAALQVSIIATDLDGVITLFNEGAENMLGYRAEEMVGRQTPAVLHLESEVVAHGEELTRELGRPIHGFDVFVASARQGAHEEREWTYVRKDGSRLSVCLIVSAVHDAHDGLTGFLGIATDITERLRAEAARREAYELLQRQITELEAFNKAMVGREQRIIEMKEEVNALGRELGREPEYPPVWGARKPR